MGKLNLSASKIEHCRKQARLISEPVQKFIDIHTTDSVERSTLRLYGIVGVGKSQGEFYPLVNIVQEKCKALEDYNNGVTRSLLHTAIQNNMTEDLTGLAKQISEGKIELQNFNQANREQVTKLGQTLAQKAITSIKNRKKERSELTSKLQDPRKDPRKPMIYVIVATGNIYEDVEQAKAAALNGADIIAVIRSTAQSLLDYVPYGPTTVGFGGTYATQENFKIMRQALDDFGERHGRYIRLTNYSSGLCMPEIAVMAALERLDMLLNDSMYGILFRDINMKRTLIDQHFSRMVISLADIIINTGEDNYLTTADAIENGHQVLASQFINERLGLLAGLPEDLQGLGHAFEMDPTHPHVFSKELSRAQMTRDIFPKSPIKYMPSTKYKSTDLYYSHLMDCMFNLVGVMTGQSIQLLGMPTEAMHTPLLQDRYMAIKNAKYIFNGAGDWGEELMINPQGNIVRFAGEVLDSTVELLDRIVSKGLFQALYEKCFGDVSRHENGGKGLAGVTMKGSNYFNPVTDALKKELKIS